MRSGPPGQEPKVSVMAPFAATWAEVPTRVTPPLAVTSNAI
ncbi:hypothetical protein ABZW10_22920 [Kitasatospora sp. NPDC004723]